MKSFWLYGRLRYFAVGYVYRVRIDLVGAEKINSNSGVFVFPNQINLILTRQSL